ncbi:hypothetical protein DFJ73DRAFT_856258 [Zopfochytrium polystomum]|nr:hypothetical protein DFJ73DRAFT_856258 [Zopfochytrium polystomum]
MLASRFPRETAEMLDGGAVTEAQVTAAIRLGVLKEIAERECSYEIDRAYVAAANLTPKGYISDFTLPEKEALQMVARKLAALGVVPPAVGQYWYDDQDDERSISTRGLYKMLLSPELFETPTAMMLVKHMCVPIDDADHRDTPAPASVAEMQDADPAIESVGVYGQPQQLNNAVFNKLQVTAQGTVVFSGLFTREKMVLFAAVIPVLINLIERLKGSPKFHRRHKLMTYELQWEKAMEHVFQLIVLLGRDFCRWNKEKTFSFWLFFLIADHLRLEGIDRSSRETGKPRLLGEAYMRTKSWQWVDADAEWWRAALFEALVELQTRVAQNKDRINAMIRKFDESSDAAKAPTTVGSRCHLYEQLQRNAVMTVIVGRPVADAFGDFDDSYVIGLTTNSLPMEPGDYLVVDAAGWCLASTDRSKVYTSTSQFAAACFNYNSSNVGYSELGIDRKSSMRTTWRVKCAVPETGSEEGSGGKRDLQALLESIAK